MIIERFDARLDSTLTQPLAVAFSGGGDSLAALIVALRWAKACGRPVIALHVDHGLQPQSGAWAAFSAEVATELGAEFRLLAWDGDKPTRGLAAAARRVRHALIANAARDAGASVVVFGHTADDLAEAVLMRAEGSSLGALGVWRPSPVWPEGREVMLFRPLLRARRAALRAALQAEGYDWIEDPANDELAQPRARARAALDLGRCAPPPAADDPAAAALAHAAEIDPWGAIGFDREALRAEPPASALTVLAAAMLSVGGGERPPRRRSVEALRARLAAGEAFTATLAGAKLAARGRRVLVARDAGELARGRLQPMALEPGEPSVWDGRFALGRAEADATVSALKGHAARLSAAERRVLASAPAIARPALPVLVDSRARPTCPILAGRNGVRARSLAGGRFLAACGAISAERTAPEAAAIRARGEKACGALS
ncbi:MAG TPA: tRNA lysidine(34) synthetase TilS [Caulobacteraceae bacterium]|nr:tRNA lysidine(34) synthetase TilS [Caulobacteraceae bacterium]